MALAEMELAAGRRRLGLHAAVTEAGHGRRRRQKTRRARRPGRSAPARDPGVPAHQDLAGLRRGPPGAGQPRRAPRLSDPRRHPDHAGGRGAPARRRGAAGAGEEANSRAASIRDQQRQTLRPWPWLPDCARGRDDRSHGARRPHWLPCGQSNMPREAPVSIPTHHLQGRARALPQDRQGLHRPRDRAPLRALGEGRARSSREVWRKAGEAGLLLTDMPEEYGGGRRRLPLQRRHDRGDGQARLRGAGLPPALRYRRALHPQLRHRGAEAHLAAAHGHGRGDHRHRHDRARHGQRPAGDPHHGAAQGQRAGRQRPEDLHHQRRPRRPRHRRRQDRYRAPAPRA